MIGAAPVEGVVGWRVPDLLEANRDGHGDGAGLGSGWGWGAGDGCGSGHGCGCGFGDGEGEAGIAGEAGNGDWTDYS